MKWFAWPLERRLSAWIVHCADMLEQAMLVDATPHERRLLWLAAVSRLVSPVAAGFVPIETLTAADRMSLLEGFFEHLRAARSFNPDPWLGSGWNELERWTRGFYLLPGA
jgi:hypothetical protein